MRKLIVSELVTLDGVMEAPGGEPGHPHSGWAFNYMGDEEVSSKIDEALEAGALLLGRVTYESFAGAWPGRTGPLADRLNEIPKHVVSTTLRHPAWNNTTLIEGDISEKVTQLKHEEGGPILVNGSRTLAQALMADDLVDEWRLMIFPVTVGSGNRLFPKSKRKTTLGLAGTRAFKSGIVLVTYRRTA